jgi:hypothetical protein
MLGVGRLPASLLTLASPQAAPPSMIQLGSAFQTSALDSPSACAQWSQLVYGCVEALDSERRDSARGE